MTDLIYHLLYTVQGVLVKKLSDYVSVKCRSDYSFLKVLLYVHLKIEESIMDVSSSGWAVVYLLCRAVLCCSQKSQMCAVNQNKAIKLTHSSIVYSIIRGIDT